MENTELPEKQPRRKFLARLMATIAGASALGWLAKKSRAETIQPPPAQDAGPILYHRTEETERYYRTLYR